MDRWRCNPNVNTIWFTSGDGLVPLFKWKGEYVIDDFILELVELLNLIFIRRIHWTLNFNFVVFIELILISCFIKLLFPILVQIGFWFFFFLSNGWVIDNIGPLFSWSRTKSTLITRIGFYRLIVGSGYCLVI